MSERGREIEVHENSSDDVATLYSWANLHGAKYRDFSASRQEVRAQARHRMTEEPPTESPSAATAEAQAENVAPAVAAASHATLEHTTPAVHEPLVESVAAAPTHAMREAVVEYVRMPAHAAPAPDTRTAGPLAAPLEAAATSPATPGIPTGTSVSAVPSPQPVAPSAPFNPVQAREMHAPSSSPAYRSQEADRYDSAAYMPQPAEPPYSRQERGSRWYALQNFLERSAANQQAQQAQQASQTRERRTPTLAVFSLAGGVGKTSLVATLGRALSGLGEQVLLADMSTYGMLPFYFGSRDVRPGLVRRFSPSDGSPDAEVHLVTVDVEKTADKSAAHHESGHDNWIAEELQRDARGSNRILVDLTTASGALTRRILAMTPTVLVPVVPDMSSVVSLSAVEQFFHKHHDAAGRPVQPFYVLNKFESSLPLHLDLRAMLRDQLGERLLPFVIRRSPDMGEALAEGMTVMDYAPESPVADDYRNLAGWMRSVEAPLPLGFRGVRWSER